MKDFKNENEYGNMKTEEVYDGILMKTGDEGYRYYSSSNSSTSSSGSGGGSYNCYRCLDKGWLNSSTNCSLCNAWRTNLAPISYTYSYETSTYEGISVSISGVCGNAGNMYIYDYTSLDSSPVQSAHASSNCIKRTMTFTPGTHYVKIYASSTCGSAEQQFTLQIAGKSYDCTYCNDTGKTNTGVCTHCDACPEDLLRVTWNENDIVALNGTNKAYVPITAEANTNYESIWIRVVVEDAETNEEIWRSSDFSTQSFTTSNCNLTNGVYNVYAVMTLLSNMTERVSEKKELHVTAVNVNCSYCNDTGKTDTGVCTHCDACPEDLLRVTWNENDIVALNGTNKAYVPITAEANTNYESIWLRIVVEDAETNEEIWRSSDFSTQSFTTSNCNLTNGTYNVYAVMTLLSNMTERVSEKKELRVTKANILCTYCNDTGKTDTGVCTHCDACPEDLLRVTWNENDIVALDGTNKAYVPITAEANTNYESIWIRVVVEDAETNEEIWRSNDFSTQSFTTSNCNLTNGTYNVYAVMTVLSNMTERVSEKKELRVTKANILCTYCNDTGRTNTGVCTHCNACPEELLRVTWNEENIVALNGTNKAYVPITAEADTNYDSIWLRIVVEDAETNEECWRSRDFSTQSITTSECNLTNGVYNVYAVMTVLSNMTERVSEKKELRVTKANILCTYCNDTGLIDNKTVCTNCYAGEKYIAPIDIKCGYSKEVSGYHLNCNATCEDGWNMCLYLYNADKSAMLSSAGASATNVEKTFTALNGGTYVVEAKAILENGMSRTQERVIEVVENVQVTWNEEDIVEVNGTNKVHVPITVKATADEPIWIRAVVEDAETDEEIWRSTDFSTNSITTSGCCLGNGAYNVYAVMTVLSTNEKFVSKKEKLFVAGANAINIVNNCTSPTSGITNLEIVASCESAVNMTVSLYSEGASGTILSSSASSNSVTALKEEIDNGTYTVVVWAHLNNGEFCSRQETVVIDSESGEPYCGYCNGTGWLDTSISCSHCNAHLNNLAPLVISIDCSNEMQGIYTGKYDVLITASCANAENMKIQIYNDSSFSNLLISYDKFDNSIEKHITGLDGGVYYVRAIAEKGLKSKTKQTELVLNAAPSDLVYMLPLEKQNEDAMVNLKDMFTLHKACNDDSLAEYDDRIKVKLYGKVQEYYKDTSKYDSVDGNKMVDGDMVVDAVQFAKRFGLTKYRENTDIENHGFYIGEEWIIPAIARLAATVTWRLSISYVQTPNTKIIYQMSYSAALRCRPVGEFSMPEIDVNEFVVFKNGDGQELITKPLFKYTGAQLIVGDVAYQLVYQSNRYVNIPKSSICAEVSYSISSEGASSLGFPVTCKVNL